MPSIKSVQGQGHSYFKCKNGSGSMTYGRFGMWSPNFIGKLSVTSRLVYTIIIGLQLYPSSSIDYSPLIFDEVMAHFQ